MIYIVDYKFRERKDNEIGIDDFLLHIVNDPINFYVKIEDLLNKVYLPWTNKPKYLRCGTVYFSNYHIDGKENTDKIIRECDDLEICPEAFNYTRKQYLLNTLGYLGSHSEVLELFKSLNKVIRNYKVYLDLGYTWTSTQYSSDESWLVSPGEEKCYHYGKKLYYSVIPFFKL